MALFESRLKQYVYDAKQVCRDANLVGERNQREIGWAVVGCDNQAFAHVTVRANLIS